MSHEAKKNGGPPNSHSNLISAGEVATYVVCPQAWWLKRQSGVRLVTPVSPDVKEYRDQWKATQVLSSQLRFYTKVVLALLCVLTAVVMALDYQRTRAQGDGPSPTELSGNILPLEVWLHASVPNELIVLIVLLGVITVVWDLFERRSRKLNRRSGLDERAATIEIKNSEKLPGKPYINETLGIIARPDAIVREHGLVIPVVVKPHGKKVRDRHAMEVTANVHAIAASEGHEPPYGILILGKDGRSVRIKNSPENIRRLTSLVEEMQSILEGVPAVPAPQRFKCKNCDVRRLCEFSAYRESEADEGDEDESGD